ncbi:MULTISPECIES: hypothetical protein [Acidiplasma]|jgi:hypothetical protein|uniref:Uncharacterized protein n=1 Tax=Acidiplasma aeolicum TaxID=507754 RepID=A0A0P9DBN6_9ARCH|nr:MULTISPECIES: hypothetical protein [Acidiplasma]KJE48987.1 hypothetical protein TZ01_06940 [Acidiplasma sp. MBA-1]KPV47207.1 hypothetical protein SE19_02045 [Acidiplasma aeolicum]KQB35552.1 hypothetical protein AOG54_02965 [Acidiplasma aeolicum]WMT54416.1 MAG: hypothetical protein RE470_05740 [Acidiplasma sp.]
MVDDVIMEKKASAKKDAGYGIEEKDVETYTMQNLKGIAKEISMTWKSHGFTIGDVKGFMPYLMAEIFNQSGETDNEILEYIDTYFRPSVLDYLYRIKNSRKIDVFGN